MFIDKLDGLVVAFFDQGCNLFVDFICEFFAHEIAVHKEQILEVVFFHTILGNNNLCKLLSYHDIVGSATIQVSIYLKLCNSTCKARHDICFHIFSVAHNDVIVILEDVYSKIVLSRNDGNCSNVDIAVKLCKTVYDIVSYFVVSSRSYIRLRNLTILFEALFVYLVDTLTCYNSLLVHLCNSHCTIQKVKCLVRVCIFKVEAIGAKNYIVHEFTRNFYLMVSFHRLNLRFNHNLYFAVLRFLNHDNLKASLESTITRENHVILLIGSCTNKYNIISGKDRLKRAAKVNVAIRSSTCSKHLVHLIYEENYLGSILQELLEDCNLGFKLTTVLSSCNHCIYIKRQNRISNEFCRTSFIYDVLSNSLNDCCFTNAGLTNQNCISLCLLREDIERFVDFLISSKNYDFIALLVLCVKNFYAGFKSRRNNNRSFNVISLISNVCNNSKTVHKGGHIPTKAIYKSVHELVCTGFFVLKK